MKIAAASCCKLKNTNPQPVWAEIQAERPDVLVLMGDNIYLEHDRHDDAGELAAELRQRYAEQFAEASFAGLLADMAARQAPVIAIYDDHDFLGNNRCGGDHGSALRDAARAEFVRAFRPVRTGDEVYAVHRLGLVDIVVLDERYHRRSPALSTEGHDALLGAAQWQWLEATLAQPSPAAYTVVVSSSTLHAFGDESWEQYPGAFRRLVGLLAHRRGTLVLSGDVHRNAAYDDSGVIELVTSAVARNGVLFGSPRKNYALLDFDAEALHVDMRSLKVGWRFRFDVPLAHWELP